MPDVIGTIKTSDEMHSAELSIHLRLEDLQGKTIHQQENNINLKIEDEKRQFMLEERKLTFEDFAPIIDGEFNASITFSNKTTDEYYVYNERIDVKEINVPVIVGRRIIEIPLDKVMPFSSEKHRVHTDPRSIYDKGDSLEGFILTDMKPQAFLVDIEDENNSLEIDNIVKQGDSYIFKRLLEEIKPGNYFFSVIIDNKEIFSKIVSVLPFKIKKPIEFTQSEPATSLASYTFVIAREYLNKGEVDKAIDNFNRLPPGMLNSKTLPIIARAYYLKNDYGKVIALLERENVEKTYSVLLLLGNACLEQKKYRSAANYFERLRKYGDTVEINNKLGALYHSLGEKEKARMYWERAKDLEKKSIEKK
jgi:tetratricopeptide (TPR) repeat protein